MTLADFTSPGSMVPQLRGQDAASVIEELSQALHREKRVPELLPFYHAALNREALVSTDLEPGMAFPHARLAGLTEVSFALGRCDNPVAWNAKTGRPVRLVFLLAVPATDSAQYLQIVSGLARLGKETRLVELLQTAPDASAMLAVLRQVPLRTPSRPGSTDPSLPRQDPRRP